MNLKLWSINRYKYPNDERDYFDITDENGKTIVGDQGFWINEDEDNFNSFICSLSPEMINLLHSFDSYVEDGSRGIDEFRNKVQSILSKIQDKKNEIERKE